MCISDRELTCPFAPAPARLARSFQLLLRYAKPFNVEDRCGRTRSHDGGQFAIGPVEAEKELADLEKKMVETKAKVDREVAPEVEDGIPEERSGQTSEINAEGPSVPRPPSGNPVTPTRTRRKSKMRLPWSNIK